MTHWRKIVSKDSKHLNHWDLIGISPLKVTIESYKTDSVHTEDGENKDMLFLAFKGAKKMLGLNVTNSILIEQLHGTEVEDWVGKEITLRRAVCRGEDCVRIGMQPGTKMGKRIPKFKYIDGEEGQ